MPTTDPLAPFHASEPLVLAAEERCWYADVEHRPPMSPCPPVCIGECTHAEREADGVQRFYCADHAYWRIQEVSLGRLRALTVGELA